MKSLLLIVVAITLFVLLPVTLSAQTDQASALNPPLSQPLIREGTLAVRLADVLRVGTSANEAGAEGALSAVGIAPRNGWIGDYPVTPDIVEELRMSVSESADSGSLAMDRDTALQLFEDVVTEYGISVVPDASGQAPYGFSAPPYPDSTVITDYYYQEGPPVVTYYAPPVDYAYLYTWVPYPFWWWNFWFPGFFVLEDFHVSTHGHGHDRGQRGNGEFVSNHFRDSRTGMTWRVDPAHRVDAGKLPDKAGRGWSTPSFVKGAQAIYNGSQNVSRGRTNAGMASTTRGNPAAILPSRERTYVSPSVTGGTTSGNQAGRVYTNSRYPSGSTLNQRSLSSTPVGPRSFSQSSGGTGTFYSSSPFGGGRGSFGGWGRR